MKPDVILVGCSGSFGVTTTTRMIEALENMDKTVLVVGENEMPDFIKEKPLKFSNYPSLTELTEPYIIDYGNKMSSRALRRKKERDSKKRKRK